MKNLVYPKDKTFSNCCIQQLEIPATVDSILANHFKTTKSDGPVVIEQLIIRKRKTNLKFGAGLREKIVVHSFVFEDKNDVFYFQYDSESSVVCSTDSAETNFFSINNGSTIPINSFDVPRDVDTISDFLFLGHSSLKSVKLHRNVKKIGNQAFAFSGLETIIFQHDEESQSIEIGLDAFLCFSIKEIFISSLSVWLTKVLKQDLNFYYIENPLDDYKEESFKGNYLKSGALYTNPLYGSPMAKLIAGGKLLTHKITIPNNISCLPPHSLQNQNISKVEILTATKEIVICDYSLIGNRKPDIEYNNSTTKVVLFRYSLSVDPFTYCDDQSEDS